MEIKVGSIYEHVNTGKSYVVTSISLLKIHGENDPVPGGMYLDDSSSTDAIISFHRSNSRSISTEFV